MPDPLSVQDYRAFSNDMQTISELAQKWEARMDRIDSIPAGRCRLVAELVAQNIGRAGWKVMSLLEVVP